MEYQFLATINGIEFKKRKLKSHTFKVTISTNDAESFNYAERKAKKIIMENLKTYEKTFKLSCHKIVSHINVGQENELISINLKAENNQICMF